MMITKNFEIIAAFLKDGQLKQIQVVLILALPQLWIFQLIRRMRLFLLLPKKNNEALIEFTLFTKNLIEEKEYESEIKKYISSLNIKIMR